MANGAQISEMIREAPERIRGNKPNQRLDDAVVRQRRMADQPYKHEAEEMFPLGERKNLASLASAGEATVTVRAMLRRRERTWGDTTPAARQFILRVSSPTLPHGRSLRRAESPSSGQWHDDI